jgi:adenosine deaminase
MANPTHRGPDLQTLPKVELHCHLDGIIDPAMAADIRRADPTYPLDPDHLAQAYPITDFAGFMRWWEFIDPIEGELAYFAPILERYIARLRAQGVVYAEVMIAAGDLPLDTGAALAAVEALRRRVTTWEDGAIQVEFLVGLGRSKPLSVMESRAARALALHRAGLVVGVALAGPEIGYPVKPFRHLFAQFHDAGLGIEIHAGEWGGPESIWDALEHGYPDRLGHAISLFRDPRLVDVVRERGIHLEMCPTSNLLTGGVARIEDHPIRLARDLGLSVSVNTDDPGVFGNSMQGEYDLLAATYGFTEADFRAIYADSLAARFQPQLRLANTAWQA